MTTYPESSITNFFYSARIVLCIIVVIVGICMSIWKRHITMRGRFILVMFGSAIAVFALAIVLKGLFSFGDAWHMTYMMKYITYLGSSYDGLSAPLPLAYYCLSLAVTGTILNLANLFVPIKRSKEIRIEDERKGKTT